MSCDCLRPRRLSTGSVHRTLSPAASEHLVPELRGTLAALPPARVANAALSLPESSSSPDSPLSGPTPARSGSSQHSPDGSCPHSAPLVLPTSHRLSANLSPLPSFRSQTCSHLVPNTASPPAHLCDSFQDTCSAPCAQISWSLMVHLPLQGFSDSSPSPQSQEGRLSPPPHPSLPTLLHEWRAALLTLTSVLHTLVLLPLRN